MFPRFQKLPSLTASESSYLGCWCIVYALFFFFQTSILFFFPSATRLHLPTHVFNHYCDLMTMCLTFSHSKGGEITCKGVGKYVILGRKRCPERKRIRTKGMEILGKRSGSSGHKASGGCSEQRESFVGRGALGPCRDSARGEESDAH